MVFTKKSSKYFLKIMFLQECSVCKNNYDIIYDLSKGTAGIYTLHMYLTYIFSDNSTEVYRIVLFVFCKYDNTMADLNI